MAKRYYKKPTYKRRYYRRRTPFKSSYKSVTRKLGIMKKVARYRTNVARRNIKKLLCVEPKMFL